MQQFLEIKFVGWTATPRFPFILSGNALCMPTPSYSMLLGMIGCCLGRIVKSSEVDIGFHYTFDTSENDLETRQRLEYKNKLKAHSKGSDAYSREFHINPMLTVWLNRVDWIDYFKYPLGTPALGRSQDLLKIKSERIIEANSIETAKISGCMIPFSSGIRVGGQLVQIAEAYEENEEVGKGRSAINSKIFMSIPSDNQSDIEHSNLFETQEGKQFYLYTWQ